MQEYTSAKPEVKLKILRTAKGWRQSDAAVQLGVAVRTLQRWEDGNFDPSVKLRARICEVFGRTDIFDAAKEAEKGE